MGGTSRRDFLAAGLLGAGTVSLGLVAYAKLARDDGADSIRESMGPLRAAPDQTTGLPLLRLPEGFRYRTFSWAGTPLHDGHPVPASTDGMGVVRQQGNLVTLVRNHELQGSSGPIGDPSRAYDTMPGGTTKLVFDTERETLVDSWVSLGGTLYNCAGGVTPWGTWLSCEEAPLSPALSHLPKPRKQIYWDVDGARREHGFVFEVPATGVAEPEPILAMGQFYHEAVAIDPDTGIAYMTEDNGPRAGFYRFLPSEPGRLQAGGRLQMMKVLDRPVMSDYLILGQEMDVEWVDIPDPSQGFTAGNRNGDGVVSQNERQARDLWRYREGISESIAPLGPYKNDLSVTTLAATGPGTLTKQGDGTLLVNANVVGSQNLLKTATGTLQLAGTGNTLATITVNGDGTLELDPKQRALNPVHPVYWKVKEWD